MDQETSTNKHRKRQAAAQLYVYLREKGLSTREIEVVCGALSGDKNIVVASKLFVDEKTVKFHLSNIFKKLNFASRHELLQHCFQYMMDRM